MNRNIFKGFILLLLFQQIVIAENETPNILVKDNPIKEVTIYKTPKSNKDNYLDIKVKKIISKEVQGILNDEMTILNVKLPDTIEKGVSFYITDTKRDLKSGKNLKKASEYTYKILKENNSLEIEGEKIDKTLYIIKYDNSTKEFKKMYKWLGKVTSQKEKNKFLELLGTDYYNSYEEILLTKARLKNSLKVVSGEILELPSNTTKVSIYSQNRELLKEIPIVHGNGEYGLKNDTTGITLRNSNEYLKLGIGFEDGCLKIKLKEWSLNSRNYEMIIEAEDSTEKLRHKIIITPPKHKLQVLENKLDLNFGNYDKSRKERIQIGSLQTTSEISVQAPKEVNSVELTIKNNGDIPMYHENIIDEVILANVQVKEKIKEEISNNNRDAVWKFKLEGKVIDDISQKPAGNYSGKTQAIVSIES